MGFLCFNMNNTPEHNSKSNTLKFNPFDPEDILNITFQSLLIPIINKPTFVTIATATLLITSWQIHL